MGPHSLAGTTGHKLRKSYYDVLGLVECGSLRATFAEMLAGDPVDIEKLRRVTLQFGCPAEYRVMVWKLLAGLLPATVEAWEEVSRQRTQTYEDVLRTARAVLGEESQDPLTNVMLAFDFFVRSREADNWGTGWSIDDLSWPSHLHDLSTHVGILAHLFTEVCEKEGDAFWCLVVFVGSVDEAGKSCAHPEHVHDGVIVACDHADIVAEVAHLGESLITKLKSLEVRWCVVHDQWFQRLSARTQANPTPSDEIVHQEWIWDRLLAEPTRFCKLMSLASLIVAEPQAAAAETVQDVLNAVADLSLHTVFKQALKLALVDKR